MVKSRAETKAPTEYGQRILEVIRDCRYPKDATFAKALFPGEKGAAQKLRNWIVRDRKGTGAEQLRVLTGVSTDWLLSGEGERFPKGPKLYKSPTDIARLEYDIDALRNVLSATFAVLSETVPDANAKLVKAVRALAGPEVVQRGVYANLLHVLETSPRTSAEAPAAAPRRGVAGSSRRSGAS